tara:strand:+ start:283 stop:393 length:111 start_codon:yes stop_codon:yes gene_type:complete
VGVLQKREVVAVVLVQLVLQAVGQQVVLAVQVQQIQ